MTGDKRFLAQVAQRFERFQPVIRIGFLEPGLHLAKDVVTGEDNALFHHDHCGLICRVARHVDHTKSVVAHMQGHFALKRDDRDIGFIIFQKFRFLWSEGGHALDMGGQISAEDSRSHSLLRDYGNVEERVPGPVVAVGFGVNDVAKRATPLDLSFQPHRVAGFVRRIDQHNAVRSHRRCRDWRL